MRTQFLNKEFLPRSLEHRVSGRFVSSQRVREETRLEETRDRIDRRFPSLSV
jgi:hypothetical protein